VAQAIKTETSKARITIITLSSAKLMYEGKGNRRSTTVAAGAGQSVAEHYAKSAASAE
jgi:hypothetical protein